MKPDYKKPASERYDLRRSYNYDIIFDAVHRSRLYRYRQRYTENRIVYSSAHFETVRYNDICRRGRTCPEMSEGEHFGIGVLMFALDFTLMMILNIALG